MNEKIPNDFGEVPIEHEEKVNLEEKKQKGMTRRAFLKALGAMGLVATIPDSLNKGESKEVKKISDKYKAALAMEKILKTETPLEQLQVYGEIKNLEFALEAVHDRHYRHLMDDENRNDMETAAANISKLEMDKITELYKARQLPEELAYMVAIQETRGRNVTSWAGARGMTGIMPSTARAMGYKEEDLDDSYTASQITAKYLTTERNDRFGNNVDMLLHAYNGGGGLFGFTGTIPKDERTPENFYKYMEDYINTRYKKVEEDGHYKHVVDKNDKTLSSISERFDMPLKNILEENGFTEETIIHNGDMIKIPFDDMNKAAKILFRKPFETLNYTPELKAKYKALKDLGLLSKIEGGDEEMEVV